MARNSTPPSKIQIPDLELESELIFQIDEIDQDRGFFSLPPQFITGSSDLFRTLSQSPSSLESKQKTSPQQSPKIKNDITSSNFLQVKPASFVTLGVHEVQVASRCYNFKESEIERKLDYGGFDHIISVDSESNDVFSSQSYVDTSNNSSANSCNYSPRHSCIPLSRHRSVPCPQIYRNRDLQFFGSADNISVQDLLNQKCCSNIPRNTINCPRNNYSPSLSSSFQSSQRTISQISSAFENRSSNLYDIDEEIFEIEETDNLPKKLGLSDFAILYLIGVGTFGRVFLVEAHENGQKYAMKVIRKDIIIEKNAVDMTHTERNALIAANHPFIVNLKFAFQTPTKLCLVMDYIPGGEILKRISDIDHNDARFYIAEIILAIEHLHSLDIIYRDLKPENVMISLDGHVCLTDFGLSKLGIKDDFETKSFCGTLHYMAPEMVNRQGHGKSSDWWAVGCLTYELFAGNSPFLGSNTRKISQAILNHKPKYPVSVIPSARDLIQRLLKKNVSVRLGTKGGAAEIKKHEFFANISWDALLRKEIKPAFVPNLISDTDVSLFDNKFTSQSICDENESTNELSRSAQLLFRGFSFTHTN